MEGALAGGHTTTGAYDGEGAAVGVEGVGEKMAAALIRRVRVTVGDPRRQRVAYGDRLEPRGRGHIKQFRKYCILVKIRLTLWMPQRNSTSVPLLSGGCEGGLLDLGNVTYARAVGGGRRRAPMFSMQ